MKRQNLFRIMLVGVLATGLLMFSPQVRADDNAQLKEQVQALQERVDQLESQLAIPAAHEQWEDPYTQMMLMHQQMERHMRRAFAGTGMAFSPKMDMKQTDKQYVVTMDIPGMDKSKINVEIKEGMLIISGERHSETENNENNKNAQYYRQERSFGSFIQSMPLPDDARKDQIDASYKNGVLTVTIPRTKQEGQKSGSEKIIVR